MSTSMRPFSRSSPFAEKYVHSVTVGVPIPLWDQNKGNILAAEGALGHAMEEPHRVELALTNNLATAYANYKSSLELLEDYRKGILPDQIRYYRAVFERREIDAQLVAGGVTFGDVVAAQQTLTASLAQYLTILGQLWTSVVNVADLLQTDDLFQLAEPRDVPGLPDLDLLPCCHPAAAGCAPVVAVAPVAAPAAVHGPTVVPTAENHPVQPATGQTRWSQIQAAPPPAFVSAPATAAATTPAPTAPSPPPPVPATDPNRSPQDGGTLRIGGWLPEPAPPGQTAPELSILLVPPPPVGNVGAAQPW